jgi:hypothetical protein
MILHPLSNANTEKPADQAAVQSVWTVINKLQSLDADRYLLISQPDHAKLSGEMAARFDTSVLPPIEDSIVKAIGVHDDGWQQIPFERNLEGEPALRTDGRPQSFMQVSVPESLSSWSGSIQAGHEVGELGEYMVSAHFSRIGRMRLEMYNDTPADRQKLQVFVRNEEDRQKQLSGRLKHTEKQLAEYVDLLQFCDVLSLYLCCGAKSAVEFPQEFNARLIRIRYNDGLYTTEPSLFRDPQRFTFRVRSHPGQGVTRIGIHIR